MKKNSTDWSRHFECLVYDPDGWDRVNFESSWGELITEEEFRKRASQSTLLLRGSL